MAIQAPAVVTISALFSPWSVQYTIQLVSGHSLIVNNRRNVNRNPCILDDAVVQCLGARHLVPQPCAWFCIFTSGTGVSQTGARSWPARVSNADGVKGKKVEMRKKEDGRRTVHLGHVEPERARGSLPLFEQGAIGNLSVRRPTWQRLSLPP